MTEPSRALGWGPNHCTHCGLPRNACVCAALPRVITRTRVVIVRHAQERFRSSNTGRLAHLCLPNSEIVEPEALAQVPMQHAMLVFPTGEVPAAPPQPLPERLLVLDASWSQARRMWRKLTPLRGVATLRLPEIQAPAARLRKAPGPGFVSTIEAVAAALRFLEGEGSAAPLEQLYQHCVARMRAIGRTGIAHNAAPSEFADVDD